MENNHDPTKDFHRRKMFVFLCKEFYTSARVDSTTVFATSLGSNSSSHDEIVCCIGGVGSGTNLFKGILG
jgi:hypothetical protein